MDLGEVSCYGFDMDYTLCKYETLPAFAFTKPPIFQENRLTGGGSPNLVDFVERKFPVERKMGAANSFHLFYT